MGEHAPTPAGPPPPVLPDEPRLSPNGDRLAAESVDGVLLPAAARSWVTPAISAVLVACFAGSIALGVHPTSPTADQLLHAGGSFGPMLLEGEWWRLLSAEFLHGGIVHLAFNLWALWGAGQFAERIYGNAGFLAIYLLSAVGATLLSVAVAPLTVSIGASGAIFGVYGALFAFAWFHHSAFPREFLQRQRSSLLAFIGYNVVYALVDRRIDAAGHAGGLAVGIALGVLLRRDQRDPRGGAARRVGAVVAIAALLAAAALGVRARVAAVPQIRAMLLGREAGTAFNARQLEVAVEKLNAAITAADSWRLRLGRALALSRLGRPREALEDARVAVDLAPPDAPGPLELRGSLESSLGLIEEAARTCGLISNRAPWRSPGFRAGSVDFCATVYLQRGDSKAALDWADILVGGRPGARAGLRLRAHVLQRTGQFDRALADLDRVIDKAPDDAWALNARAWLRLGSEDFTGARKDADRAVASSRRAPLRSARVASRSPALGKWRVPAATAPAPSSWRHRVAPRTGACWPSWPATEPPRCGSGSKPLRASRRISACWPRGSRRRGKVRRDRPLAPPRPSIEPTGHASRSRRRMNSTSRRGLDGLTADEVAASRRALWDEAFTEVLLRRVPAGAQRLVDVGCGLATAAHALLPKLPATAYVGVDADADRLEQARKLLAAPYRDRVELRVGRAENLPLQDGEAEAALISMTLQHLSDPGAALGDIARVLRPGGTLIVAEPDQTANPVYFDGVLDDVTAAFRELFAGHGRSTCPLPPARRPPPIQPRWMPLSLHSPSARSRARPSSASCAPPRPPHRRR